jgi:hypothetical protein
MPRVIIVVLFFVLSFFCQSGMTATLELIYLDKSPQGPIQVGLNEIERAFTANQWMVTKQFGIPPDTSEANLQIILSTMDPQSNEITQIDVLKDVMPTKPESYTIQVFQQSNKTRVYGLGIDDVGTMYAAFEICEQITLGPKSIPLQQRIKQVKRSPTIPMRGVKITLHREALQDPFSWFHLETYWEHYFNALARARFNFVDIHGVYDWISNQNYSLLPYFTHLDQFASLSIPHAKAERNLRTLKRVIEQAHDHGLRVSLMTNRLNHISPDTPGEVPASFDEELYLRQAINYLVVECDQLDGFGIYIGEPGKPASYYQHTAIRSLSESNRNPILFLRTDLASPEFLLSFTDQYKNYSVVEVKFNGDFLAMPYPVTGKDTGDIKNGYQTYLQVPRKYGILFQLEANGSHRLFPWLDYAFIRKTIDAIRFCDTNGFVLESLSSITPNTDIFTNNMYEGYRYYDWAFERDWYWYRSWGALAFDIDTSEDFLINQFNHHFGELAGSRLYAALKKSSHVIPAIHAVYNHPIRKEAFAPEFDPPPGLDTLLQSPSFDPFMVRSIATETEYRISSRSDGRRSPLALMQEAVRLSEEAVVEAENVEQHFLNETTPRDTHQANRYREWKAWTSSFTILENLAKTWHNQISAAMHVRIFQLTQDLPSLIIAAENLKSAQQSWDTLAQHASNRFTSMPRPIAGGIREFHWFNEKTPFRQDLDAIMHMYTTWVNQTDWTGEIGHLPQYRCEPGEPILLTLSAPPANHADAFYVHYQNSAGVTGQIKMEPSRVEGVVFTEIPARLIVEGFLEYFFFAIKDKKQIQLKGANSLKPYQVVITADTTPPSSIRLDHAVSDTKNQLIVTGQFSDPHTVTSATLFWKELPSSAQWQTKEMIQTVNGFEAVLPLTPAGLLYSVECMDGYGNVRRIPDMADTLPFRVIQPFAAK